MSTLTHHRSTRTEPATPGAGASAGALVRMLAPTSALIILSVLALDLALVLVGALHSATSNVMTTAVLLATLTVLAGFLRSTGCWRVLRGCVLGGASRRVVGAASLGCLVLHTLLQLPAGVILVITSLRAPNVVLSGPGGAAGTLADYALACLGANALGLLTGLAWDRQPRWGGALLVVATVIGTEGIVAGHWLLGLAQWFLPTVALLADPLGTGLDHAGWALLVGPATIVLALLRWEPTS